jgi:hypothetical protein
MMPYLNNMSLKLAHYINPLYLEPQRILQMRKDIHSGEFVKYIILDDFLV